MLVKCPKCEKKYNVDEDKIVSIKKKQPQCTSCGSPLFPSEEHCQKTVLMDTASPKNSTRPDDLEEIGGYKVQSLLGRGGMGSVYKCLDEALNRFVAIKVLTNIDEDMGRERFLKEAQSLAKLSHPNITQIYSTGEENGLPFFVMEHVDGPSTGDMLKEKHRFPIPQALDIAIQVCHGLKKASEIGLIHRDIKPANILINADKVVKITDFGLAKLVDDDQNLTKTKMTLGTPSFISPEQAKAEKIDFKTDIYSLGVTLYRYIVGQLPFVADDALALVLKHIKEPVKFPAPTAEFSVPPAIAGIIRKMMAKNPQDRFLNYDKLIYELERLKKSFQALQEGGTSAFEAPTGTQTGEKTAVSDLTGFSNTMMNNTVMMPSNLSSSSPRVPPKLIYAIGILGMLLFVVAIFKFGGQPASESTAPENIIIKKELPESFMQEVEVPASQIKLEATEHFIEQLEEEGGYRIFGKIINIGENTAKDIYLTAELMEWLGKLVATKKIKVEPQVVMPGEKARFSFIFKGLDDLNYYYQLQYRLKIGNIIIAEGKIEKPQ